MKLGLEGCRAIVTGGSGGIGGTTAEALAREGVVCTLLARGTTALRVVARDIAARTNQDVHTVSVDLGQSDGPANATREAVELMGGVDILVNAAARVSEAHAEDLASVSDQAIAEDFEVKYLGYLRMARAVVPLMKSTGWGRIVNVSGLAARRAGALSAGARNAAVVHLSATLAHELGRSGITVNTVHPGVTVTRRLRDRLATRASAEGTSVDELLGRLGAATDIGRLVTAEEVAAVITFLASDVAAGITGEAVAVGGGVGAEVRL